VWTAAFRPGDGVLATSGRDGFVRFWDVPSGRPAGDPLRVGAPVGMVAFSPDGRFLAVVSEGRPVEIRPADGGRPVARLDAGERGAFGVAFSIDGGRVAVGRSDGRVQVFRTDGWKPAARPWLAHPGFTLSADFAPDGRLLATAGTDGTARLFEAATGRPVGAPIPLAANRWANARFSPDGTRLLTVSETGDGVIWPVSAAAWRQHACAVAGRELTAAEWRDLLPDRAFDRVCG
jgi:WD40 repeat protein